MKNSEIKQKAEEIFNFYNNVVEITDKYDYQLTSDKGRLAKSAALFMCKEMIKEIEDNYDTLHASDRIEYWQQIKSFIENNY